MNIPGKPPFELVQLSTLPQVDWHGRVVFHPMEQHGGTAFWMAEDSPSFNAAHDEPGTEYDVGVVVKSAPDDWRGPASDLATWEVHFIVNGGFALHYSASNLWTIKPWCVSSQ